MPNSLSIIIPTYCEADNLRELVPTLCKVLDPHPYSVEVIVVDDNSPDATREVCAELERQYPLRLLVREHERGLSSAVLHGMRHARGEVLVVMDADLSHPPEKVPDLIEALLSTDADFVIGSRYVAGGQVEQGWGLFRWLNSLVATVLAWPLTTAKDPMAGFFAIRRDRFEAGVGFDPVGYKIGLELMVKCGCKNVKEIPITFRNRLHGESKLTLKEQVNYLRHLKRLYEFKLGRLARPLQFLMVGATGMVVDLVFFCMLLSFLPVQVARALAIWVAMTWNFGLNRRLTFSYARSGHPFPQYCLFCLSCLFGASVNWLVSLLLYSRVEWFHEHTTFAAVGGIIAGTGFNYLLSSQLVFVLRPGPQTKSPLSLEQTVESKITLP